MTWPAICSYGGWAQTLAAAAPLFGTNRSQAAQGPVIAPEAAYDGPLRLDGERLRTIRRDRGIADAALRRAAGCPLSKWRALVAGRALAEPPVIEVICRTLGVSTNEIAAC